MQKTDRFTKTLLLLLVLGVWGLLVRPLVPISPAEAQSRTGAKWEYFILDSYDLKDWNARGKQGWEMVQYNNAGQSIYKRPLK